MIRKEGYYISEGLPWEDWHAGHKFEGVNYEVLKFLSGTEIIVSTSKSHIVGADFFIKRMEYIDKYSLIDDKMIEITINQDSEWEVTKYFTILSPEILLDKNLKEYQFVEEKDKQ